MAYDMLGNYITDDSNETDTPVQDQKQQYQSDIASSVQPSGPVAPPSTAAPNAWDDNSPLPNMPQGPAAPNPATPPDATNFGVKNASTWDDTSAGPVAPPAPGTVAAKAPPQPDYNTYTAQNESGSNPNIGYHDQSKGTAYGTYGLTAAAYKDIQAADPVFKDRPITSLTPDEQAKANTDYKGILAKQLQAQGLDPSEANIRLAHFMGAKGAADYLKTGAVSPQAAAANGGVDNVQKIAQARLAGTPGAASGATNPTHAEQFVQATQNPKDLAALRNDENAPAGIRQAAADQDYENLKMQRDTQQAQQKLNKTMQSGNWLELAKELNKQSDEGSIYKAMFYQKAGLADLAKQEQQKLGAGRTWQTVDLGNGRQGVAQIGADGAPVKGYTDSGPMAPEELASAVGLTGAQNKTAQTQAQQAAANLGESLRNKAAESGFQYPAGYIEGEMKKAYNTTYQTLIHPNGSIASLQSPQQTAAAAPPPAALQPPAAPAQGQTAPQGPAAPGQTAPAPQQAPAQGSPQQDIVQPKATVAQQIDQMMKQRPDDTPDTYKKRRDSLAAIDPDAVEEAAQQVANYAIKPTSLGRGQVFTQLVTKRAGEIARENGETYDAKEFDTRNKTQNVFANGKEGQQVRSADVALDHIAQFRKSAQKLDNDQLPAWNYIANTYAKATGQTAPTSFEAAKEILGDEIVKSIIAGGGTEKDRDAVKKTLSAAHNPQQLAEVLDTYSDQLGAQIVGLRRQWTATGLSGDKFDKKLSDRAKDELRKQSGEPIQGKTSTNVPYKVIQ